MTPQQTYPEFYGNDIIQTLAPIQRWTVSGSLTPDDTSRKAPIDFRHLTTGCSPRCTHPGAPDAPIRGAWATDSRCLVDLPSLTEALPNAANATFYLKAATDGVLVLDVEKTGPRDLARHFLSLPNLLYSEVSMSGHGLHLVFALPSGFHDTAASTRRVLREAHGWYEVLLEHWVTFTRRPVTDAALTPSDYSEPDTAGPYPDSIEQLLSELSANLHTATTGSVTTEEDHPDIPHADRIVAAAVTTASDHFKTLADFDGDTSRWEFSTLSILYSHMRSAMATYDNWSIKYSDSDRAWLLFDAARQVLPHRDKHDTLRNHRPYLLQQAASIVASRHSNKPQEDN